MAQPSYISFLRHGEATVELPITITDALYYGFVLKSDSAKVQTLVDNTLNRVTGGEITYSFFGGHVLLSFVYCPHATSPTEIIGFEPDHEALFFVPLLQRTRRDMIPRLRLWVPYLFIDSGLGMATGREVWGYNKTRGQMRIPIRADDPAEFASATMIYPTLAPETRGQFVDLLKVTRTDQRALGALQSGWASSAEIMNAINHKLGGWFDVISGEAHNFLNLVMGNYVPMINLKQFRDEEDNSLACYQSLVECEAQVTKLRGAGILPGNYELLVTPCESHQIEADFGLSDRIGEGRHGVTFAFWVNMDFTNPPGRRIWKAP